MIFKIRLNFVYQKITNFDNKNKFKRFLVLVFVWGCFVVGGGGAAVAV